MYIYWPVILMFISVLVVFNPLPIMYHKSRQWFAYSLVSLVILGPTIPPLILYSGDCLLRRCIPSSSETSFLAISFAPKPTD